MNISKLKKENIILTSLYSYYTHEKFNIILPIISGDSEISLRLIEWFVTIYTKKNKISFLRNNIYYADINMYDDYKLQLKTHKKKLFDPFSRGIRIFFCFNKMEGKCISTTIAQLNFFKWAINNNVLDYIKKNLDELKEEFKVSYKYNAKKSD